MSKKVAFITGVTGQDGSYLAELLLEKKYEVHGMIRRTASYDTGLIDHIKKKINLHYADLESEHQLCSLIYEIKPTEIYNLASQSDVRISFDIPEYTGLVTGIGVTRVLEAMRVFSPESKFYQASSSELFGASPPPQHEETPMVPRSPYAAAKLYAHCMVRIYREAYGLFACAGILFNHESPRRGINFVTRKITKAACDIASGKQEKLFLGNLEARRDWGYAPDYVELMWKMLQQDEPEDFVIGTGEAHTVEEFVEKAFQLVGLEWENHVAIDPRFYRPTELHYLCADPRKAREKLGWKPSISFEELIKIMVEADGGASTKQT